MAVSSREMTFNLDDYPLLKSLKTPRDLRTLPEERLVELAGEIRRALITHASNKGGHFASNLGVVELTLALHVVYDFPEDRLVFDVGHQVYPHKLLTGRLARFDTIREEGGLSGYPEPSESEQDLFRSGHASVAISAALGLAEAAHLAGKNRHVVALVGDGSLTGGLAFEGLNNAGHLGRQLLVVLNDNRISISPTIGALSRYLSRLRSAPVYNKLALDVEKLLDRFPVFGESARSALERVRELLRALLAEGSLFSALGFRYFGPVDGHDLGALIASLRDIRRLPGPVLLHAITEKGKGFRPAEGDPVGYHTPAPFLTDGQGARSKTPDYPSVTLAPLSSWSACIVNGILELARQDQRVVAITAAMPEGTGLFRFQKLFPARYYDVGISEQHAVAFAAGLAREGWRPFVCVYSTFLQRAYDQVFHDVCLQDRLPVVFCVDRAGLVGEDGPTHQGPYDVAYLRVLPGITLMAPKDAAEARAMLRFAHQGEIGPCALRYPRGEAPESLGLAPPAPLELGRGEILRSGTDAAILAYGAPVESALRAAELLQERGLAVTVANARFAKPIDQELVVKLFASHPVVLTVEEGALSGGFGSAVLEVAAERGLDARKLKRAGVPDYFIPHASRPRQLALVGLDAEGLAKMLLPGGK